MPPFLGCQCWSLMIRLPPRCQGYADSLVVVVQSLGHVQLFATSCCICCTPGFPVFHYLPEFAQTHVHWLGDAIQPSHPLSSPSPLAFNLSQHQGLFPVIWLFALCSQSIGTSASATVLPINIQGWFPWGLTGCISWLSKGLKSLLQHHSSKAAILQCSAFLLSSAHICTWLLEKP